MEKMEAKGTGVNKERRKEEGKRKRKGRADKKGSVLYLM